LKTLVAKIERLKLFRPAETVVVAVSGGADSVVLLDILNRIESGNLRLVVVHLNHCLRGAESDADEEFVAGLAAGYGVPSEAERADVAALSRELGVSLEDAGRRARYDFFARIARKYGATSIALAHHRDDQAETVLIRLLRGAGGSGLSAMALSSQGVLKRPLLKVSRAEIAQYLKVRKLTWRSDASNADTAILRNSIRHELIPFLARYNPNITERLAATAEILACDEELLEAQTEHAYARLTRPGGPAGSAPSFDLARLAEEPRGMRLRLYRRALCAARGDLQRIGLSHLEAIDRLVLSPRPNCRVKLPGDCVVRRSYGLLQVTGCAEPATPDLAAVIEGPGVYPLANGQQLRIESVPCPASLDAGSRRVAYFDPAAAPFPWQVRALLPGDRFRPLGMTGSQKVKSLFINEKIPPIERSRIPLLLSSGRIIWVCGLRVGDEARITGDPGLVLSAEILDISP